MQIILEMIDDIPSSSVFYWECLRWPFVRLHQIDNDV